MIRDGLLDSERVQKRSIPARWLFVCILLMADDVGLFEVSIFKLHRAAALDEKEIPGLLKELADADLIRPYAVNGKRFGFVPRYGQRLQVKRTKHPAPPTDLMRDDDDATNKINRLASNPPLNTVAHGNPPPEPEPEPEVKTKRRTSAAKLPTCPFQDIVGLYHELLPEMPEARVMTDGRKNAIAKRWAWVLTSERQGKRRATNAAEGLDWLRRYFTAARDSDFLMGRTAKTPEHAGWRCSIDFLMGDKGLVHVMEKSDKPTRSES